MAYLAPYTIDVENDKDFGLLISLGFTNGSPTDEQILELAQALLRCSFVTSLFPSGLPHLYTISVDSTRNISITQSP